MGISLNHAPEAAIAGADEADIEFEGIAEVLLGKHFVALAVGLDLPLAENHAAGEFGQDVYIHLQPNSEI